eukprot:m.17105 g.17105  ORF g.17105 m.17105 type:complete len:351 (+) comp27320_c0_seq2:51-1103(+)
MGNAVPTAILTTTLASSRKRKREEDDEEAHSTAIVEETPARKKSRATSLYIYETMFVQGANTDVVIAALGKEWRLHRIYLCQSSYFCALFNGHWKDSNDPRINIEIVDPNINVEALHATFGSFYKDDVSLTSENVISILATSRMFHLEGLLQQCADFMSDHVDPETVCGFHQAAHQYAVEAVESQCFEWLQERLLTIQSVSLLREVSEDLLCRLVQSSGLFVMQVEMDLYTLAKQVVAFFFCVVDCWYFVYRLSGFTFSYFPSHLVRKCRSCKRKRTRTLHQNEKTRTSLSWTPKRGSSTVTSSKESAFSTSSMMCHQSGWLTKRQLYLSPGYFPCINGSGFECWLHVRM